MSHAIPRSCVGCVRAHDVYQRSTARATIVGRTAARYCLGDGGPGHCCAEYDGRDEPDDQTAATSMDTVTKGITVATEHDVASPPRDAFDEVDNIVASAEAATQASVGTLTVAENDNLFGM